MSLELLPLLALSLHLLLVLLHQLLLSQLEVLVDLFDTAAELSLKFALLLIDLLLGLSLDERVVLLGAKDRPC